MFYDKTICLIGKKMAGFSVVLSLVLCSSSVLHAADERSYAQDIQRDVAEDKVYLLENIRQKVTIPSEKTIVEALLSEDGPQAILLFQKQLSEFPDPALDKLSASRIAAYNLALKGTSPIEKSSIPLSSTKTQPIAIKADTSQQAIKPQLNSALPSVQLRTPVATDDSTKLPAKPRQNSALPSALKDDSTKHSTKPQTTAPVALKAAAKEKNVIAGPNTSTLQFGSFESHQNAEALAGKISQYASVEIVQKGQMYKVLLKTHYASKEEAAAAAKKLPVKAIVVPSI